MISFKQYLSEERESERVTINDGGKALVELFKGRFSESAGLLNKNTLYRGTSWSGTRLVKSATEDRKPKDGGEYYTPLLDTNPLNKGWPSRKRSTIVSNSKAVAHTYGETHLVFPVNGTKIAVLETHDMWVATIKNPAVEKWAVQIVGSDKGASLWNVSRALNREGVHSNGLTIQNLEQRFGEDKFKETFGELTPEQMFSYKMIGASLKTINQLKRTKLKAQEGGANEMWFEGECLMVPTEFEAMLRRLLTEEGLL